MTFKDPAGNQISFEDLDSTETVFALPPDVRPVPPLPKHALSFEPAVPGSEKNAGQPGGVTINRPATKPSKGEIKPPIAKPEPRKPEPAKVEPRRFEASRKVTEELHLDRIDGHSYRGDKKHDTSEHVLDAGLIQGLQKFTEASDSANIAVSKNDLAVILDGFAKVLRGEATRSTDVSLSDHETEVLQMKGLLLEAQETIIALLNDRVYDRAKIARLEAEIKLLPDLQAQATRAMGLASKTEDFQRELVQMKDDLGRMRQNYLRSEQPEETMPWWRKALWLRK